MLLTWPFVAFDSLSPPTQGRQTEPCCPQAVSAPLKSVQVTLVRTRTKLEWTQKADLITAVAVGRPNINQLNFVV